MQRCNQKFTPSQRIRFRCGIGLILTLIMLMATSGQQIIKKTDFSGTLLNMTNTAYAAPHLSLPSATNTTHATTTAIADEDGRGQALFDFNNGDLPAFCVEEGELGPHNGDVYTIVDDPSTIPFNNGSLTNAQIRDRVARVLDIFNDPDLLPSPLPSGHGDDFYNAVTLAIWKYTDNYNFNTDPLTPYTWTGGDGNTYDETDIVSRVDVGTYQPQPVVFVDPPNPSLQTMVLLDPVSPDSIAGTVYNDIDHDGTQDAGEPGVAGVTVTAYDASGGSVSTTTDSNGAYTLAIASGTYRVEITDYPSWLQPGVAAGNTTTVIASSGTTVDFNLSNPESFCASNPDIAIACYTNGDPTQGGTSATNDAIVSFAYNNTGRPTEGATAPNHDVMTDDVGSVWGMAYDRENQLLYSAAFLKRHVGLTDGLGAIYRTDYSGASPSTSGTPFVDVQALGINVGTIVTRSLPANFDESSHDVEGFNEVGKVGLGGLEISPDGQTLYVVNLAGSAEGNADGPSLVALDISGTPSLIDEYQVPNPGCGTDWRPFANRISGDELYVGGVCNGEVNGSGSMQFAVYAFDTLSNNFSATAVFSNTLNYTKEPAFKTQCDGWNVWIDDWSDIGYIEGDRDLCHPQPMLSDIDFDVDGDMIFAFMDRMGHIGGVKNYGNDTGSTTRYQVVVGGDLLRADFDGASWTLESGGMIGTDGCGANGEGPDGGEFYFAEEWTTLTTQLETAQGTAAILPGSNQLTFSAVDPLDIFSGGMIHASNTTGQLVSAYELYYQDTTGDSVPDIGGTLSNGSFSKANGLGEMEFLCAAAPIEIGDYVWYDTDGDGIQDPNEAGIDGVDVMLYNGSTLIATATTANGGQYLFSSATGTDTANIKYGLSIQPATTYQLRISLSDHDLPANAAATSPNQGGQGTDNHHRTDLHDSDAGELNSGFSTIQFTTSGAGVNNQTLDFGFVAMPNVTPSIDIEKIRNTPDPVTPGTSITFTIRITNTGTTTITTLPLTDTYSSAYLTFVGLRTTPEADTTGNTGQIVWSDLTQAAPNGFGMDFGPNDVWDVVVEFVAALDTTSLPNSWTINTAQAFTHTVTDTVRIFAPTNVVVSNRHVVVEEDIVVLSWSTVDETDLIGFHVLRIAESGGEPIRLTSDDEIILVQDTTNGADYRYVDATGDVDANHHYILEMVMADETRPLMDIGMVDEEPNVWVVYLPMLRR
ncbi:MAG: SdrD B-like domain-containing protein [Chloroflexota bacterium]